MKQVKLNNGYETPEQVAMVLGESLSVLIESDPIAFYELVETCRKPQHKSIEKYVESIKRLGLMEDDGTIRDEVRAYVVSAVTGEGIGLILGSPVGRPFGQEQVGIVDESENPTGKFTTPCLPTMRKTTTTYIAPKISVDDPSLISMAEQMAGNGKEKDQIFAAIHTATGGSMLDEELCEACRRIASSAIASFKSKSDPNIMQ